MLCCHIRTVYGLQGSPGICLLAHMPWHIWKNDERETPGRASAPGSCAGPAATRAAHAAMAWWRSWHAGHGCPRSKRLRAGGGGCSRVRTESLDPHRESRPVSTASLAERTTAPTAVAVVNVAAAHSHVAAGAAAIADNAIAASARAGCDSGFWLISCKWHGGSGQALCQSVQYFWFVSTEFWNKLMHGSHGNASSGEQPQTIADQLGFDDRKAYVKLSLRVDAKGLCPQFVRRFRDTAPTIIAGLISEADAKGMDHFGYVFSTLQETTAVAAASSTPAVEVAHAAISPSVPEPVAARSKPTRSGGIHTWQDMRPLMTEYEDADIKVEAASSSAVASDGNAEQSAPTRMDEDRLGKQHTAGVNERPRNSMPKHIVGEDPLGIWGPATDHAADPLDISISHQPGAASRSSEASSVGHSQTRGHMQKGGPTFNLWPRRSRTPLRRRPRCSRTPLRRKPRR